MTTGETPCLPCWLAELLQLSAVLVHPDRRALCPGQTLLLIALAPVAAPPDALEVGVTPVVQ